MKDRHWRTPYHFGSLTVWGTSLDSDQRRAGRAAAPRADLGIYLDDRWHGEADALRIRFVDWPKLEAPTAPDRLLTVLDEALGVARDGGRVEIACFGGHGRTGTALAVMDVLTGATAADAVARARYEYCPYAVGSTELELFVEEIERGRAARAVTEARA